jgi:hypothetical protein
VFIERAYPLDPAAGLFSYGFISNVWFHETLPIFPALASKAHSPRNKSKRGHFSFFKSAIFFVGLEYAAAELQSADANDYRDGAEDNASYADTLVSGFQDG